MDDSLEVKFEPPITAEQFRQIIDDVSKGLGLVCNIKLTSSSYLGARDETSSVPVATSHIGGDGSVNRLAGGPSIELHVDGAKSRNPYEPLIERVGLEPGKYGQPGRM